MVKTVSYIEYLADSINKSNDINDCLDAILEGRNRLRAAQNEKTSAISNEGDKNINPENLVEEIKAYMNKTPNSSRVNMAEKLENALKQRIAKGDKTISHAIINSDSYEIYDDNGDKQLSNEGEELEA